MKRNHAAAARRLGGAASALLVALLVLSGCNQVYRGFARFQLVNHTPYNITFYAVARTKGLVENAENRLSAPLAPNSAADADVALPGKFWLRAVADVNGTPVEKIEGPVEILDGNVAWSWHMADGQIQAGTGPEDVYAATNLPAVVIDTNGGEIVDDPKILSAMHVAYDPEGGLNKPLGSPTDYVGPAGIELRGNSSQTFPEKSFGVETWDEASEGTDVELLGFPEEEDWVFYAPWMDRSLVRNVLGYSLWGQLGNYSPRTRYVDLYLNTTDEENPARAYQGVYVLTEKVKRDKNRVNIKKLDPEDIGEDKISGGYILEMKAPDQLDLGAKSIDIAGDFVLAIEEPSPEDIPAEQEAWITDYIADFEAALFGPDFANPETGYAAYIDVNNFVDFILFQDFLKNRDAFRSSMWFYKDRDKKLKLGPVWDLDIAFGYFSFNGFQNPEGWFLQSAKKDLPHSPWTDQLFKDPAFVAKYIARWKELRGTTYKLDNIYGVIDGAVDELATANVRNFVRWDTLGKTLLPDIRFLMFLGPHPKSWQGEIKYLKDWIGDRAAWMDAHIDELAE